MNKKLKKALQNAFEPPKPIHEKEFIKQFPQPTISTLSFVLSQIRYIQKYVWIVSFAVFLIALMGARAFEKDVLWAVSYTHLLGKEKFDTAITAVRSDLYVPN